MYNKEKWVNRKMAGEQDEEAEKINRKLFVCR